MRALKSLQRSRQRLGVAILFATAALLLAAAVLLPARSADAAVIAGGTVVLGDSTAGATTTVTLEFTTVSLMEAPFDGPIDQFSSVRLNFPAGFDASAGTLISWDVDDVPLGVVLSIPFQTASAIVARRATGDTPAASKLTLVFGNVVNPGAATPATGDFTFTTGGGESEAFDNGTVSGVEITAPTVPTVTAPILDQTIAVENGAVEVTMDLNGVFTDANGGTLSFSDQASHDATVVTVALSGVDNRILNITGLKNGMTTVTIRATDNPLDGTVDDMFDVTVRGLIDLAVVTPASLDNLATGTVAVTFRNQTALLVTEGILIDFPDTFGIDAATPRTRSSTPPPRWCRPRSSPATNSY